MAADLNPEWFSCLPSSWSYGVTRDGRVFFINEEGKSTSWLHPVTGEAVITGHIKTPDLPTGWEEGFSFEGARCFINHNERKVTCKHPVSGQPSQDNCIFVVSEQPVLKGPTDGKKDRPLSTMSEASNFTGGSDYTPHPGSPAGRPSRSSKKVHNFGKRSNSIKRNPNAPVVQSNWLYKQDSTGMKLWKKRWFVLSDMCLFYYRDEKEEGILGSILLPSFHISMLSVDDHINRKYAFKVRSFLGIDPVLSNQATHPNMRTYYFCTDTAKDMESWMKAMTDAALVHTEPIRRVEKPKVEQRGMTEGNSMLNHKVLTRPEMQNNEHNREAVRWEEPKLRETVHAEERKLRETVRAEERKLRETVRAEERKLRETVRAEERKLKEAERYGFQSDGVERSLTKISSIKLQPAQAAATAVAVVVTPELNGSGERSPGELGNAPGCLPERTLQRTNSMQQLEHWVRTQRVRGQEEETRSITSYQTLPRNMPSHRPQAVPRCPEGYRTLPRNMLRPDSICSISPSLYERALGPPGAEKRRSMRDDTMWQLYEWQQRQACTRQGPPGPYGGTLPPGPYGGTLPPGPYGGTLPSPKTMVNLSEHAATLSIPPSPSHGSLALYQGYSPLRSYNAGSRSEVSRSEVSSPIFRGDVTIDRRHRTQIKKYGYPPDRRSMPAGIPVQTIAPQSLLGKKPEELTLLLIKLRRQQAELHSLREHTVAQLMQLNLDAANPKNEILSHHLQRNLMYLDNQMKENDPLIITIHTMIENSAPRPQLYQKITPEDYRDNSYICRPEEPDIDAKLSRLCEQDKVVRTQEEKLQLLHREKHTLETALLSASQEIEMSVDNPAAVQSVVKQRDVLQSGLLSTCRELSRVTTELERSWREHDRLESEVFLAKNNLLEQLEALGSPQTEPPSQQHVQIQKELWRIQDVMEVLTKNRPHRSTDDTGFLGSKPMINKYKSEDENSVPPRPPLPPSYDISERPPAVPPAVPCPGSVLQHTSRQPLQRPEERKAGQRNGAHSGPDYRLYKSEPELTTVAEVDETSGEDRSEQVAGKEPPITKGVPYPVGIVPPRAKLPMPESSTIASYVTLRKNKKPDPRTDRPRSAVEQLCVADSSRPRMTLDEQLERIRRHQQASLRDKKKDSPSSSASFSKENPFRTLQNRKRDVVELETSLREQDLLKDQETPAEEIARLQEAEETKNFNMVCYVEPEPEAEENHSPHRLRSLDAKNSMQTVLPAGALTPEDEAEPESATRGQERMISISYQLAVEASNRQKVNSLSSPPESPISPSPTSHPPLPDGSHFMCV